MRAVSCTPRLPAVTVTRPARLLIEVIPRFPMLRYKPLPRRIRLRNRKLIFYLRRANAEKLRKIMLSEELSESEKLDRLHALIPPDAFKIDNLNQATPAQLRQLNDGLAVTDAMQQIRRRTAGKKG